MILLSPTSGPTRTIWGRAHRSIAQPGGGASGTGRAIGVGDQNAGSMMKSRTPKATNCTPMQIRRKPMIRATASIPFLAEEVDQRPGRAQDEPTHDRREHDPEPDDDVFDRALDLGGDAEDHGDRAGAGEARHCERGERDVVLQRRLTASLFGEGVVLREEHPEPDEAHDEPAGDPDPGDGDPRRSA